MNLPNKLTVLRILLVPVFLVLLMIPFNGRFLAACVVFVLAALTDLLDGKIARKHQLVTSLGKFLDPIADKVLTTAAFLGILVLSVEQPALNGWLWTWCLMLILAREFVVATVRMMAAGGGEVVAADLLGKIKTVMQYVVVIFMLLLLELESRMTIAHPLIPACFLFGELLMLVATVLTVISGAQYTVRNWHFMQDKPEDKE